MEGEKKKKSKKKSKRDPMDDADEEIERAMRQMDKAMADIRIAEEAATHAARAFSGFTAMGGAAGGPSITVNHFGSPSGNNPLIFVNGAKNMQIGNNNVMNIGSETRTKKKKSRVHRESSSSDIDSNEHTEKPQADPVTRVQPDIPLQDRDPNGLTPSEKKRYNILNSKRVVSEDDIKLCTVYIGQFARFLRLLGLEDTLIDDLKQENQSVREIIYQGMLQWKQKRNQKATVGALANVLQKVDCDDALVYFRP